MYVHPKAVYYVDTERKVSAVRQRVLGTHRIGRHGHLSYDPPVRSLGIGHEECKNESHFTFQDL